MEPVLRSGRDPLREDPPLVLGERHLRVGRRHDEVGVGARDPGDEFAVVRVPGHDRAGAAVEFREGRVADVEPQPGLPVRVVRPMALEAAVGEDRPHVPGKIGAGGTAGVADQERCDDEPGPKGSHG